jgi:hypothetical protein
MTDNTNPGILAKRIEMIAWNLAEAGREEERRAALSITPVAETADTVTLRRADYDALVRLAAASG